MTSLALVDRLRALGPELAREVLAKVERDLGPSGVAALRYDPRFFLRPSQVIRAPYATIEVIKGERGTGKSHTARELFTHLLPLTNDPRIVVPTDGSVAKTVYNGPSGLKRWTPPWVRCEYVRGAGYAGDILYGDKTITVTSAAAPVGGIGPGYGLTWADDIAAWIEAVGVEQAARAWNHLLKSNREQPGIVIVATTGRAAEFLVRILREEEQRTGIRVAVRVTDLGAVENNATNLGRRYMTEIVPGLRAANEWEEDEDPSGAFAEIEWAKIRARTAPRLKRIVVAIDPAKSSRSTSCEVGIVGVGIDDRDVVYGLADASDRLSALQWPARAADLFDELRVAYPGVRIGYVVENNAGGEMPAGLVVAEDKIRNLQRRGHAISTVEIEEVTSRKNDSKVKRAGPVVTMAKRDGVRMLHNLGILEKQLSELTDAAPGNDRADAFVHGARELAGIKDEKAREGAAAALAAREAFAGFDEAQAAIPAPSWASPAAQGAPPDEWDRV